MLRNVVLKVARENPEFRKALVGMLKSSSHRKNIALMKWLSKVTSELGVAKTTYVVGGAVRNYLINQPIKDIDIVIDTVRSGRDSEWLANKLSQKAPVPVHVTTNQYGVAIVTIKGDWFLDDENLNGEVIEIANARKESYGGESGKGYKPSAIEPATIEEDVLRREFTFNTLLWDLASLVNGPEKADILDLTGCGRSDLEDGMIKCPMDPDVVFSDDPTRMLRAIKFSGKYGFKVPKDVAASIRRNAPKLKRMPWEAVATILVKDILNQPTARKSLPQLLDLGLLDVVHEMIQESKPFATFMVNQLRTNRKVQLLLDLMNLGLPSNTPISFLDAEGQDRLRQLTVPMDEDQAADFVDQLLKPSLDAQKIIAHFNLEPQERGKIIPLARRLILRTPDLAYSNPLLTREVIKEWL